MTLFATARSLFPTSRAALHDLCPPLRGLGPAWQPCGVAFKVSASGRPPAVAVGLAPSRTRLHDRSGWRSRRAVSPPDGSRTSRTGPRGPGARAAAVPAVLALVLGLVTACGADPASPDDLSPATPTASTPETPATTPPTGAGTSGPASPTVVQTSAPPNEST